MATDGASSNGSAAAVALLTEQRDRYAATLKRLIAQHKGVESKMNSTRAKLEATEEAIKALVDASGKIL